MVTLQEILEPLDILTAGIEIVSPGIQGDLDEPRYVLVLVVPQERNTPQDIERRTAATARDGIVPH